MNDFDEKDITDRGREVAKSLNESFDGLDGEDLNSGFTQPRKRICIESVTQTSVAQREMGTTPMITDTPIVRRGRPRFDLNF
jgi:hypothetical protein